MGLCALRPHRARHRVFTGSPPAVAALALLVACGDGDPSTPTPSPTPSPSPRALAYAPCPAATRVGGFQLELADGFTAIEGRVASGVVPANILGVTREVGSCKLLQGRTLFCDPACGASQTCGEAGACIAFPTAQSVGAVSVSGLTVALSMTPSAVNFYSNGAVTIPHPGFTAGSTITLTAAGGTIGGFTLAGEGVEALVMAAGDIVVDRGQPVALRWTPASNAATSHARLRFVLDLAHHGGISASIDCDGLPDTGSFDIPAELTTALLDIGVAGFPTVTGARRSADSTTVSAGCVELTVSAKSVRGVVVPGLESCGVDDDCPAGKTCQPDLTCG